MKTINRLALLLILSPFLAFLILAVLHPLGDPQESPNPFVRFLDYQITYGIRNGTMVPPVGLCLGTAVAFFLYSSRFTPARRTFIAGLALLVLYVFAFVVVPLALHVN